MHLIQRFAHYQWNGKKIYNSNRNIPWKLYDAFFKEYATYRDAADAMGLLANNNEWIRCLEEAAHTERPKQLRQLFAHLIVFNGPLDALDLWNRFKNDLSEDFTYQLGDAEQGLAKAYWEIDDILSDHMSAGERFSMRLLRIPEVRNPNFPIFSLLLTHTHTRTHTQTTPHHTWR